MITARSYCPKTRRVAATTLAVSVITAAALVFPESTWAAVGNNQICNPSTSCTVGEFVYDDSYDPVSGAICTITSRYPNGSLFLNNQALTEASESDGWYFHTFTAPTTTGLYRTVISCTVSSEVIKIDKSFEVKTETSGGSAPTADEVAAATWSYSSRTLSSFGSLISDIWNAATRTLTGTSLNSGSIATKSDVDRVSGSVSDISSNVSNLNTNINSINSKIDKITTNVQNTNNQVTNIFEGYINQPIIHHVFESGGSSRNLDVKMEQTSSSLILISSNTRYLESKAKLAYQKWNSYSPSEISQILGSFTSIIGDENFSNVSMISSANKIYNAWNFNEAKKIVSSLQSINISLQFIQKELSTSRKSDNSKNKLAGIIKSLASTQAIIGNPSKNAPNTLYGRVNEMKKLSLRLDSFDMGLNSLLKNWDKTSDLKKEINNYEKNILAVNLLPKVNIIMTPTKESKDETVSLKNHALSLLGVVKANKKYLSQDIKSAVSSTFFEIGSIIIKTIISNPSESISQKVPLNYELPKEVKKEHILSIDDGLTLNYDQLKNTYVLTGFFTLAPKESKTLSVEIDDKAFEIPDTTIESLRLQAEELLVPLKNTSFFAQGVTLKSDINASLDKAKLALGSTSTPEEKIRNFRDAQIEINSAKEKIDHMKEVVAQASSAGAFLGFVGGAQAVAVWGMILVMIAGFVSLMLYMRSIRRSDLLFRGASKSDKVLEKEPKNEKGKKEKDEKMEKVHSRIRPSFKAGMLVMGSVGILGGVSAGVISQNIQKDPGNKTAAVQEVLPKEKKTLGINTENAKDVTIFVPQETSVSLYAEPLATSTEIATLTKATTAKKVEEKNSFTLVVIDNEKKLTGWVDSDFIEESLSGEENLKGSVTVNNDIETSVNIRNIPVKGNIIRKAYAGDSFTFLSEEDGWVKVKLENGESGYISNEFVTIR